MSTKKALAKRNGGHAIEKKAEKAPHEHALDFGQAWDYAPAPESPDHVKLKSRYELFIGGKFVVPSTGKHFDSINPATEEKLTEIALGGDQDVDMAVKAARQA